jgi:uncharacterized protein YjdB
MASPVVAGVAGLVLAASPGLSVGELKNVLTSTVDRIPALTNRTISGGRVNAFNALQSVAATPPPPPAPPAQPLSVSPANPTVAAGASLTFTASGGTAPYSWSVNNPAVGNIGSTGVFTGISGGSVTVTATDSDGTQASQTVNVTQMNVTPNTTSVGVGQSVQFSVSGGTTPYQWSTSNTQIASINNATGVLFGNSAGSVVVTVTDANNIQVNSGLISVIATASVSVSPNASVLAIGDQQVFTASGGSVPYTWQSSNPAVLSVNGQGVATANGVGTASITATDSNGVSGSSGLIQIQSVQVVAAGTTLVPGGSVQLNAVGGTPPYTWQSSNNAVASVDNSGTLVGVSPGSVTVSATDRNGIGGTSDTISVVNTAAATLTVTPETINVPSRWWVRFKVSGGTPPYVWSLTNPNAGTVSSTTGWYRASTQVNATTTVVVTDGAGNTGQSSTIMVLPAP